MSESFWCSLRVEITTTRKLKNTNIKREPTSPGLPCCYVGNGHELMDHSHGNKASDIMVKRDRTFSFHGRWIPKTSANDNENTRNVYDERRRRK